MIGADPDLAVSQSLNAIRNATRFSYERMTPDEESFESSDPLTECSHVLGTNCPVRPQSVPPLYSALRKEEVS